VDSQQSTVNSQQSTVNFKENPFYRISFWLYQNAVPSDDLELEEALYYFYKFIEKVDHEQKELEKLRKK
jgi:hypothetical protein